MNPEISIVIPAYNSADTIERCLASLVPQAHEHNAEIIVIDSSTAQHIYPFKVIARTWLRKAKKNQDISIRGNLPGT